jgi:hypothetical protein
MVDNEDVEINEQEIEQIVQGIFDFEDDEPEESEYQVVRWDTYDQIALERMSYESY